MTPIVALLATALAAQTSVRGISVVSVEDRTEVVIEVDGPVSIEHFVLRDPDRPDRLVVDMSTARKALSQTRFDGINRGGVLALRVGQFKPEVVRVVIELAQSVEYRVNRGDGEVRISFPNPMGAFAPWYVGDAAVTVAPPPEREHAAPAPVDVRPAVVAAPAASPLDPPARRPAVRSPAASSPPTSTAAAVRADEPPITIHFDQVDILDVLVTFAEFSGRSIVPGAGVTGTVTADIRDQPWDIALEAILTSHGLAAQEGESGIIRVAKLSDLRTMEASEPLRTQRFQIRYGRADSALVETVRGLLSDSIATVTANPATNTIVVTDRESVLRQRIAPMIEQLDVRTPQVMIEAKIIFVDQTSLEALGVVYDLKDSRGNQLNRLIPGGIDTDGDGIVSPAEATNANVVRLGGASLAALGNANFRPASPTLEMLTTLVLNRYSLITFIDALQSLEFSDIQARPVISTLDHRPAQVHVGERTPVRVVDAGAAGGGGGGGGAGGGLAGAGPPRATVRFEDTGIILNVTPHVTGDQVLLELHAERSNVALAPSDIGFTFQKQATDTQILLKDGQTGVISGMTIIEKQKVRVGIPLLMDLPVIGALFRSTTDQETKQDLLIMVTPHIQREGEA